MKDVRIVVFDFDGTLIDSNQLKYDAYFDLFPDDAIHANIVREVLQSYFEESRFVILERILRHIGEDGGDMLGAVQELAARYNGIVLTGAKLCPEKEGAQEVLDIASQFYKLYISSTTPGEALAEIIRYRKWEGYFSGVFGYPPGKGEILRQIMEQEGVKGSEVVVVGDGVSDCKSAEEYGCKFFHITPVVKLRDLLIMLSLH